MSQKQKNLIGGISLLGLAGIICKLVGVLYRIPLAQDIGADGIGIYQLVFPSYNLLLTISSAGVPVAISRMVSSCLAQNDPRNARRVFRASLMILTGLGIVTSAILAIFSGSFASATGSPQAQTGFLCIAPSLLLVCVMSAFRGIMQGRREMAPTAVSQLIEQVGKVFIALPMANLFYAKGQTAIEQAALGAAGALMGTSVAEALALVYMAIRFLLSRKTYNAIPQDESRPAMSYRYLCWHVVLVAVPITIGACIVPLAGTIDSFMLVNIMDKYMAEGEALRYYGVYSALVLTMINVPTGIAMAMSINLVPSVSNGFARQDFDYIRRESATGLKLASLIGLPCSVGMSMLAEPILSVLYGGGKYSAELIHLGGELLSVSALTIWLFTMVQASSGILQGMRRQSIPMWTLLIGVLCKVALNYTLVRIPSVNIHGAPFASLLCYTVSAVPNLIYVCKHAKMKLSLKDLVLLPGAATAIMAGSVFLMLTLLGQEKLSSSLPRLCMVIFTAIVVYFVAAVFLGAIRREDLPGKFKRLARK